MQLSAQGYVASLATLLLTAQGTHCELPSPEQALALPHPQVCPCIFLVLKHLPSLLHVVLNFPCIPNSTIASLAKSSSILQVEGAPSWGSGLPCSCHLAVFMVPGDSGRLIPTQ